MTKRYILTVTAANRVGALAALGTALADLGGNLHEASQTMMQGFFAIMLAVDFPREHTPDVICNHLRDVCRPFAADVSLKDATSESDRDERVHESTKYYLTAEGPDRSGVLRGLSGRLAKRQVDIVDFYGVRDDSDDSFHVVMELAVPHDANVERLRQSLQELGEELGLAIAFYDEAQALAAGDALLYCLQSAVLRRQIAPQREA